MGAVYALVGWVATYTLFLTRGYPKGRTGFCWDCDMQMCHSLTQV